MTLNVYTSANLAYSAQCATLLESIRLHEPTVRVSLLLVNSDLEDNKIGQLRALFDEVITSQDLLGKDHREWMNRYNVVEACTSVKGRALRHLLEREQPVVYLDPDTMLFSPLDNFRTQLDTCSILLTPHQVAFSIEVDEGIHDEMDSLLFGVYNLGMLGVRPTQQGKDFARWWDLRLERHCLDDSSRGLFTDQKWMDLAPVYFPETRLHLDAGVNVASWNLHNRFITLSDDGAYLVNGQPLVLYHFTKIQSIGRDSSIRKMLNNPLAADLVRFYLERLENWQQVFL